MSGFLSKLLRLSGKLTLPGLEKDKLGLNGNQPPGLIVGKQGIEPQGGKSQAYFLGVRMDETKGVKDGSEGKRRNGRRKTI